jgi:hypothetical protein
MVYQLATIAGIIAEIIIFRVKETMKIGISQMMKLSDFRNFM